MSLPFALAVFLCSLDVHQPATLLSASVVAMQEGRSGNTQTARPLTACGPLRRPGTRYLLQNDVEAPGTCFSIEADHVTLDLGGHTVTYGTTDGAKATFGVIAADCWYQTVAGNPCGGSHRYAEILNGKIVQGTAAAAMSHALRMGQANNLTGVKVHDLEITVHAPDSIAIYTEYLPGGSDVYRNTIHNNVIAISSRTQFRGASIKLEGESGAKLPDQIHHNVIRGGAQLGIRDDNPAGTQILDNDISQDATFTNGFCIDAAGANMKVYGNQCHPVHGRGIHTNQSNVQIYDNLIETIDSDQNQEYKGCEINGTYGIQVESDNFAPTHILVSRNHVKVHAAACPAEAMRLTDLKDASVEISNNEFVAVTDAAAGRQAGASGAIPGARGFSVGNVQGGGVVFTQNRVQADTAMFHMDWDGGGSFLLKDNHFVAGPGSNGKALLAEFGNGTGASERNYFLDNTYEGFSPDASKFSEYAGDSWFAVTRSFTIRLVDQNGNPVKDAEVKTVIETGETVAALTDGEGSAQMVLPSCRVANKKPTRSYTRHQLRVKPPRCEPEVVDVDMSGPQKMTRILKCR